MPGPEDALPAARGSRGAPALVVLSSLFPSAEEPLAGLFIRERMFRVAGHLPVTVVAPVGWFPLQGLLRPFRPGFRLTRAVDTVEQGIPVRRPRYVSVPGPILLDGAAMALACAPLLRRAVAADPDLVIDAHFAYPDGYAAHLLARWLRVPYTVTLRGTELRHGRMALVRPRLESALRGAARVFAVSDSLRQAGLALGADPARSVVVPNGVDVHKFNPVDRAAARRELGLPPDARVLITVGGLVRRKGFHRVIEALPALRARHGDVRYLVVGGASREGDERARLEALVRERGLQDAVVFAGGVAPDRLRGPLSAADVFVLPSANEGWANVLLESMACGTPVVASDVGGNREVVADPAVGTIFALDEPGALEAAVGAALARHWDRDAIVGWARRNSWDDRIERLLREFAAVAAEFHATTAPAPGRG